MRGRAIPLSRARRLVADILHFSQKVPTNPVLRVMNLSAVRAARAIHPVRPSWMALFAKAFARVSEEMPELRRAYVKFPWPHLYEYPVSIANLTVEREYEGEKIVLFARIVDPFHRSVVEVHDKLQYFRDAPVDQVPYYRKMLRISGYPWLARRILWWFAFNLGRLRGSYLGTFGITVVSALGAESLHPHSPLTCLLTYGVIAPDGSCAVRICYDHRVLDEAPIARVLARLEEVLNGEIAAELRAAVAKAA